MNLQKKDFSRFLIKLFFVIFFFLAVDSCFNIAFKGKIIPFTNYTLLNYKIFDYAHNKKKKEVLAIGSSLTLVNLESNTICNELDSSYLNLGVHGMCLEDIYKMAKLAIPLSKPKTVLMSSGLVDFRVKSNGINIPSDLRLYSYLRNPHFLPLAFTFSTKDNAFSINEIYEKELATNTGTPFDIHTDSYGGISLNLDSKKVPKKVSKKNGANELILGSPTSYEETENISGNTADENSYKILRDIARYMKNKGIRFVFIQSPCIKSFYAFAPQIIDKHSENCRAIIESEGGLFINGFDIADEFDDDIDFYDSGHMNSSGSRKYTRFITDKIKEKYGE